MDVRAGHKEMKFDPTDKKDVRRILKFIREKEKEGYYLYGAKVGGEYVAIHNLKDVKDEEITRFVLTKKMKKKMIAMPPTGG